MTIAGRQIIAFDDQPVFPFETKGLKFVEPPLEQTMISAWLVVPFQAKTGLVA